MHRALDLRFGCVVCLGKERAVSGDMFEVDVEAVSGLSRRLRTVSDQIAGLAFASAASDLPGSATAAAVAGVGPAVERARTAQATRVDVLAAIAQACADTYVETDLSGESLFRGIGAS